MREGGCELKVLIFRVCTAIVDWSSVDPRDDSVVDNVDEREKRKSSVSKQRREN